MAAGHEIQIRLWASAAGEQLFGHIFEASTSKLQSTGERQGGRCKVHLEAWVDEAVVESIRDDETVRKHVAAVAPSPGERTYGILSELHVGFWFLRDLTDLDCQPSGSCARATVERRVSGYS